MNFNSIVENVSSIIPLNDAEIELFTTLIKPVSFVKKDLILRSNEVCKHRTFIFSGCTKMCHIDDKGVEHVVTFGVENSWIFDLQSYISETPSNYNVEALEDVKGFTLSKINAGILHSQFPKFEVITKLCLAKAYAIVENRLTENLHMNAEEKYIKFKNKYPDLEHRISQKEIASYLGITPEFFSLMKRKMSATVYS